MRTLRWMRPVHPAEDLPGVRRVHPLRRAPGGLRGTGPSALRVRLMAVVGWAAARFGDGGGRVDWGGARGGPSQGYRIRLNGPREWALYRWGALPDGPWKGWNAACVFGSREAAADAACPGPHAFYGGGPEEPNLALEAARATKDRTFLALQEVESRWQIAAREWRAAHPVRIEDWSPNRLPVEPEELRPLWNERVAAVEKHRTALEAWAAELKAETERENRKDYIGEMLALAAHPAWMPSH